MNIEDYNCKILDLLSQYLNFYEKSITKEQIDSVVACGVSEEKAYSLLLQNYLGLDDINDREFINMYFPKMIHKLSCERYKNNEYMKNIHFNNSSFENWQLKNDCYEPYEAFVCDDFCIDFAGKLIPQIGFFSDKFSFPAVFENNRQWMSVTPNEIETMLKPIDEAFGNVVTFGLGLGYYAYMCSIKNNVQSVTIIEKDKSVIKLFESEILPQFSCKDKIHIINDDAFEFLETKFGKKYDYAFVDIYHDAGDGKKIYKKIKPFEKKYPYTKFAYWIEKTIKYYL